MVKVKAPRKQQRGVDFKKIKRKIGRKLPPPNNATNTEIKSKAIILPEQSVASEKAGLALSKKGLTLKELLQQTSHHNAKVRKDALMGIRDIFLKYPAELRLHKLAVVEKLRERISDDDKLVRETLYQLLKSVIFPGCKEDNQGPFISLMMAYIFNAMTNLAIDVRLMAFRFFDLVIQHHPSSFMFYAEKIFQNYEDLFRKNQFHLQERGTFKNVLAGLVHCLSLLSGNMANSDSLCEQEVGRTGTLHAYEQDEPKNPIGVFVIREKLRDLMPVLVGCFQDTIHAAQSKPQLDAQSLDCLLSILESVDLAVRFFTYGVQNHVKDTQVSVLPYEGLDATTQSKNISQSLLKLFDLFPLNPGNHVSGKGDLKYYILNVKLTEIFLCSSDWQHSVASLEKFLEFIANLLFEGMWGDKHSEKVLLERNLLSLVPFIPRVAFHVAGYWRSCVLQAFTNIFRSCSMESPLKWVCFSAIEEMLLPGQSMPQFAAGDTEIIGYQITWTRELALLLTTLSDKQPLRSKSVLTLLLRMGQCAASNSLFGQEYDQMQYYLAEFYCTSMEEGNITYGPFVRLDRDVQELSICCLYYLSEMQSVLLKSIVLCCLYDDLEPSIVFRIMEVLHSAYRVGRIQISDLISFFITLLARFNIVSENSPNMEIDETPKRGTFKSITRAVCCYLLQMGDGYLILEMLEKVVLSQMALNPSLDNLCALLRVLVALDCRPTRLSNQSIIDLSKILSGYLIEVIVCFLECKGEHPVLQLKSARDYYLLPCFFLFYRSEKLLSLVLNAIKSLVIERASSTPSRTTDCLKRITAVGHLILLLNEDRKIRRQLSLCKLEIESILESILILQSYEENMAIDEKLKISPQIVDFMVNILCSRANQIT